MLLLVVMLQLLSIAVSAVTTREPRIAIVTGITPDRVDEYAPATNSKRCYALRHGYEFIVDTTAFSTQLLENGEALAHGFNPWWHKVLLIEKYLPYYDWLFVLDADTVVTNYTINLNDKFLAPVRADVHLILTDHPTNLNDGALLIRRHEWSFAFVREWQKLTRVRKTEPYGRWAWDDNGALYAHLVATAKAQKQKREGQSVSYQGQCSQLGTYNEYGPLSMCFKREMEQLGMGYRKRSIDHVHFVEPPGFNAYDREELPEEVKRNWPDEVFWTSGSFVQVRG